MALCSREPLTFFRQPLYVRPIPKCGQTAATVIRIGQTSFPCFQLLTTGFGRLVGLPSCCGTPLIDIVAKRQVVGECVYCGCQATLTRDHIPPKCLFGTVPESELVKVPSCRKCNGSASKDDEYFRLNVALRSDVFDEPDVRAILPSIQRSLRRDNACGFRQAFLETIEQVEAATPGGIVIGKRLAYNVNLERLSRVPARIVRGLFWKHRGSRMPDDHRVVTYALAGFEGSRKELDQIRATVVGPLLTTTPFEIGRAFSYWVSFAADHETASAWMMRFYNRVIFIAMVLPKDIASE